MTIQQIINETRLQLADKYEETEIESFVRILFKHYMKISSVELHLLRENEAPKEIEQQIFAAGDELKKYRPIQYILGETEFYGLTLELTPDVLIPRPETEELVDSIVRLYDGASALSIADIGCGSGCIALALKKNFANACVWAIDVSEAALVVARRNAERNNLKINFLAADVLKDDMLCFGLHSLDVIVSNPPYVTVSEKRLMLSNVLEYEPHCALFAPDDDPFIFYKHITAFAQKSLINGGRLFFEINEAYPDEVAYILKQHGFSNISLQKDVNEKWRIISALK